MAEDTRRDEDERDEDDRDEDETEGEDSPAQAGAEEEGPDPNVPRNRGERRAAAKAARRGRTAKLADDALTTGTTDDPNALEAPTTSMGGDPRALDGATKRPKVPPRTMSRGTGTAEGVPEWARGAGDWFATNRATVLNVLLAVVVLGGGFFGWRAYSTSREARATSAYADALRANFAAVTTEEIPADDPRHGLPHYRTTEDRSSATLNKLRATESGNPNARVTPLVRLTEASLQYQSGRYNEAKALYLGVLGRDLAGLEARAIEGLAFTLESLNDLDGAMARYRELQNVQDGAFRDLAQYYQARLLARRDDNNRAKDLLHAIIERLGRPAASDPTAGTQSNLREQAITLLRDIDPGHPDVLAADRQRESAGPGEGHGHGGGNPMQGIEGLPPELREQLQKMMRDRGGAGGGAPGGSAPGGSGN